MPNRTLMIMVGPDGVGKTTLLATMYHEMSRLENPLGLKLAASEDTHLDLQEAYQKLSTIIAQPSFTPTGPLLKGTAGLIERQFEMQFKGQNELDLVLCDIAGGIIRAKPGNPDFDEFQQRLEQALVIMNVIDGAALVEGFDVLARQTNAPERIYQLLQPALIDQKQNHLLLFVITKCEAWLKNETRQNQLKIAFETQYQRILELIGKLNHTVGVLIPVKTLGCVEFTYIDYKHWAPEIVFVRKPNLPFQPENTDQPMRYALAFALLQHHQNRPRFRKFWQRLWQTDVAFKQALTEFAQARSRAFKVYGNASLIEVTS